MLLAAVVCVLADPAAAGVEVPPERPVADFNGDYYGDLAVGVPSEEVNGAEYAGAVNVVYGGPDGLGVEGNQLFTQAGAVYGDPQIGAAFGSALAVGDFDLDGYDDLAVGAPGWDEVTLRDAGLVVVLYGSSEGLIIREGSFLLLLSRGARFGSALAAGGFDRSGADDLAVGAPYWSTRRNPATPEVGGVSVLYGSRFGFSRQWWYQGSTGVAQSPDQLDHFGTALAVGDFDFDGRDDLAVGAPGERVPRYLGADRAGVVHVMYGSDDGLTADRDQLWGQSSRGIASNPEQDDGFGSALAAGDLDHDLYDDLVVGAPGETDDRCPAACSRAGAVHVLYGTETGLRTPRGRILRPPWSQQPTDFEYGSALAIGDLDGDRFDDLAIGVPGWRSEAGLVLGLVRIQFGSGDGLDTQTGYELRVPGGQEATRFGHALSAGDFDGNFVADLAVGAPGFDVAVKHGLIRVEDAGAVEVFYGEDGERPPPAEGAQSWSQGELSILDLLGESERGDLFGLALAP
jgi:hypothetical protein